MPTRSRRRCFQGYYPLVHQYSPENRGIRRDEYKTSLGIIVQNPNTTLVVDDEYDPATLSVRSNPEHKNTQSRRQGSTNQNLRTSRNNSNYAEAKASLLDHKSTNQSVSRTSKTSRRRSPRSASHTSYSSRLSLNCDASSSSSSILEKGIADCDEALSPKNGPLHENRSSSPTNDKNLTHKAPPPINSIDHLKSQVSLSSKAKTNISEENNKIPILPPLSSSSKQNAEAKTKKESSSSFRDTFMFFRLNYLIVHIAIMLADGLQGTHLYVLYEGYGYSVASLYCLGFVSGALTSPFIGPLVDKVGRKRSAMLYCALEMMINYLEQMPNFAGLIISRVVGGITTNLLFSVFETWLVTEHRRRGFAEEKLETILRDSVIASNLAAIVSGYIAHVLAARFGPVGPFEGAVTCTGIALVLVAVVWTENYGSETPGTKSIRAYMGDAVHTIVSDSKISRIGIIQGLTEGSLQTFVFLWSPALRHFATNAPQGVLGLDENSEPAYGLIFGAFMACGVVGGFSEHLARKAVTWCVSSPVLDENDKDTVAEVEGEGKVRPVAVEFLASLCYFICSGLLITPFVLPEDSPYSFSIALVAFLIYEFMVGLYMPCEGVIRSLYMPTASMCSLMTMLRVIVNVAVALGVVSTNYIPFPTAFAIVSCLMVVSAMLQLSLVSEKEWHLFMGRLRTIGTMVFVTKSA